MNEITASKIKVFTWWSNIGKKSRKKSKVIPMKKKKDLWIK
jgi:hypothetical protein